MRSECSDSDDDECGPPTPKKVKTSSSKKPTRRKQKYRKVWETYPEFKELSSVKKHCKSDHHNNKLKGVSAASQSAISSFLKKPDTAISDIQKLAHTAEIRLAGFFAEHNIPFMAMDHLEGVLKSCFPDSKIADAIHMKRTKCTAVVSNVIGENHKQEISKLLKSSKFSILTDESTDIGTVKTSCIVVRYFDLNLNKIVSRFWNLCNVFELGNYSKANEGATGENLFKGIIDSLKEYDVPIENIIGFASDGCNVMMGAQNSVMSRFKEHCPGITVLKCICHSLHLCASEACKYLPRHCEDLVRNIYNFFGASAKRQAQFHEFQVFLDLPIHKLLHPSQTRWLSLEAVVVRVVEQWDALRLYFNSKYLEERLIATEEIHRSLNDPFLKLYFLFLVWVLPKFTSINKYFQSSKVVITELHEKMQGSMKDILLCFMDRTYVMQTKISEIDPNNVSKFLPDSSLYLGVEVMKYFQKKEIADNKLALKDFVHKCKKFLQIGCLELKKRYNFDDNLLPLLSVLTPKKALSNVIREVWPSIVPLAVNLPKITPVEENNLLQKIDDEWRKLPITDLPLNIKSIVEPDEFWAHLLNLEDNCGEKQFSNLSRFALSALSLPHSNAECERVFSRMNLIKVKSRNRLNVSTINGCILANQCVKSGDSSCDKFNPTEDMLKSMSKRVCYNRPSGHSSTSHATTSDDDCDITFE